MTKEDVKSIIKESFKEQLANTGTMLTGAWMQTNLFDKLNPVVAGYIKPAIAELVAEGFITEGTKTGYCIVLTQQGVDELYPESDEYYKELNKSRIKELFAKENSKVGDMISNRMINLKINPYLNPKERDLFSTSLNEMINDDLIEVTEKGGGGYILLQKFFDLLY